MEKLYYHKQTGHLSIVLFIMLLAADALLLFRNVIDQKFFLLFLLVNIGMLVLFISLTVSIDNDALELWFGKCFFRKIIQVDQMKSCNIIDHPSISQWGIKRISDGWVYSVTGASIVEIIMKTGEKYLIGTYEPRDIKRILDELIADTSEEI